jgi:hypothetical protein
MTAPSLVGRTAELEQIQQLVDRCGHTGEVLTVAGAAGIGKSSLLDAAAEYARQSGRLVLHTTGVETETRLPFAGLHDLLRPVLRDAERLPTAQRRALLSAFGLAEGVEPEPFLIALAGLNLLAEVASRRTVVVIADDVQWLDQISQETLSFVARRIGGDPVAIIAGVRDGHTGPLTRLALPRLHLEGLDDESATELLNGCAPDLDAADRTRILREAVGTRLHWWNCRPRSGLPVPTSQARFRARFP